MKAVILVRVSTKDQEDGHSLAAQEQRLKDYCARKGITILRTFEIVESSTMGGRKHFLKMLDFIRAQKEKIALVADAVDRVQRSFKESVVLDELLKADRIELHFFREAMILNKDSNSSDIMRWDFSVLGAKGYTLNLSENVRRSLEYKRKNGEWSGPAPLGYINVRDPQTKKATLATDPERAWMVRRIFEEYATGLYSINEMAKRAKTWGLRNKIGAQKALAPSQIHMLLQSPFYFGDMCIKGIIYPHHYERLISKSIFDQCQQIRTSRGRGKAVKQTKEDFILRGLITCAASGRKVTSDIKKGKFIYLICRDPENIEKKLFVPEGQVLKQLEHVFNAIRIPDTLVKVLTEHLKASHESEQKFHRQAIETLQKEHAAIEAMQNRLLDTYLAGSITKETYDTKQHSLKERQHDILAEIGAHQGADDTYRITVSSLFSLASEAYDIFMSSKNEKKRELINFVFSNLSLKGKKLEYSLRPPFNLMANLGNHQEWLRG